MRTYWITFTDRSTGSCDGIDEAGAMRKAEELTGKTGAKVESLPYPASPVIWQHEHPEYGPCPPFCYLPRTCAGRTSCPTNPSCTS